MLICVIQPMLSGFLASNPRPASKTKTCPPASRHTPQYAPNHRGSSVGRRTGPWQRFMSHDRASGSTGFSVRCGIQLCLIGRSDLRSGQLRCQRVVLWLSDICRTLAALLEWRRSNRKWAVGRSCSFVSRKPFRGPAVKREKKKGGW